MLKSIVYISSTAKLLTESELHGLLLRAHENNTRNQITGMMLYKEGNFMQAIEGEEEKVNSLYNKIEADPRHKTVILLISETPEKHQFGDWSMAFNNVDLLNSEERECFSPFLKEPFTKDFFGTNPNNAMKLLLSFRKSFENKVSNGL